eukprot:gene3935-5037_t
MRQLVGQPALDGPIAHHHQPAPQPAQPPSPPQPPPRAATAPDPARKAAPDATPKAAPGATQKAAPEAAPKAAFADAAEPTFGASFGAAFGADSWVPPPHSADPWTSGAPPVWNVPREPAYAAAPDEPAWFERWGRRAATGTAILLATLAVGGAGLWLYDENRVDKSLSVLAKAPIPARQYKAAPAAPTRHATQYYEMYGNRSIYANGWKAVVPHRLDVWDFMNRPVFSDDNWELYNLAADPGEQRDVAA